MNFKIPGDRSKFSLYLMLVLLAAAVALMVVGANVILPVALIALDVVIFIFGYVLYDEALEE
ncbi:MAG: hypothetical protein RBQ77_03275 [Candidatus Methanomethylophilaceae archaeon]|jgi:hypothetical protein|nr:hypothetical protein [Candidatus Methanomethylophilaceae archaeon]NLF33736.1 hypothetical protein [Thermoplasmatales archaeon]